MAGAHPNFAVASHRASKQMMQSAVVGVIPYSQHFPTGESKTYFTLSHGPAWYVKRCCVCVLFIISLVVIAAAAYIFFGPASILFTDSGETSTEIMLITVPRRVTPSPDCERNARVEECPVVVSSAVRESPWYVCSVRGRPCSRAWTAKERCLGSRGSRFRTLLLCRRQCAYKRKSCAEGPESCPCGDDYRRINYVHLQGRGCTHIAWGRCVTNGTPGFTSERDCHKHCQDRRHDASDPYCDVEGLITRPCTWLDKMYRFYYDIRTRTCLPWSDDVCQPDSFSSLQLCSDMCQ